MLLLFIIFPTWTFVSTKLNLIHDKNSLSCVHALWFSGKPLRIELYFRVFIDFLVPTHRVLFSNIRNICFKQHWAFLLKNGKKWAPWGGSHSNEALHFNIQKPHQIMRLNVKMWKPQQGLGTLTETALENIQRIEILLFGDSPIQFPSTLYPKEADVISNFPH